MLHHNSYKGLKISFHPCTTKLFQIRQYRINTHQIEHFPKTVLPFCSPLNVTRISFLASNVYQVTLTFFLITA